jgi:hypothetical protein
MIVSFSTSFFDQRERRQTKKEEATCLVCQGESRAPGSVIARPSLVLSGQRPDHRGRVAMMGCVNAARGTVGPKNSNEGVDEDASPG